MMTNVMLNDELKGDLLKFLSSSESTELISTYLYYLQNKFNLHPILYPKDKIIYESADEVVKRLEKEGGLWKETEIKITFSHQSVNDQTKRIYICPFSGKVFGDNTHPTPQDAIYDWVSKCPENTERIGGLRVKRFYVSEDPEVIRNYMLKEPPKKPISKVVYSSVINGKLFNSQRGVVNDFVKNYLKEMSLIEVQSQNKYQIEDNLLAFLQKQLVEDKIRVFVEALAEDERFIPYIEQWVSGGGD